MYFSILVAGFSGGALRGIVGFIKHQFAYKKVDFKIGYFLFMIGLSGLVGVTTTWAINGSGITFLNQDFISPALAFIVGYAGGDFLENIYKIIVKKNSIY